MASGSVPPPEGGSAGVWRAVRSRDSTSPPPSQRERMSYPSIHSLSHLCARPWAWCWRHWVLGTDDKVLLAERPVQGGKTVKKETQKGRYIFANPDNRDQSHPHCYRGRRLRPREGQRQLGVTQQVTKGPTLGPRVDFLNSDLPGSLPPLLAHHTLQITKARKLTVAWLPPTSRLFHPCRTPSLQLARTVGIGLGVSHLQAFAHIYLCLKYLSPILFLFAFSGRLLSVNVY